MSTAIKVLGICGSLRQASYNAAALRAAQELAPAAGIMIETADISDLPLYNEDLRTQGFPAPAMNKLSAQRQRPDRADRGLLAAGGPGYHRAARRADHGAAQSCL